MLRTTVISVILLCCYCSPAAGAEIDSVTPRGVHLEDSLLDINRIFHERIAQGVSKANERAGDIEDLKSDEFCDEELLYTELRKAVFQSFTASWGLKGYQLDKELRELLADKSYRLRFDDSIYRDISYLEGFSLKLKELIDVVNINGQLVGLDKIGHMFAEGWQYFAMIHEDGHSLNEAMRWGQEQEEGKFGSVTTGIFSYADLVANFHGYRFWSRVLGDERDPLKSFFSNWFSPPYVDCNIQIINSLKHRKLVRSWEVQARFDLGDYLDGVWDERNNCNSYAVPQIEAKVKARIDETDPSFRCPLSPQSCSESQRAIWASGKVSAASSLPDNGN